MGTGEIVGVGLVADNVEGVSVGAGVGVLTAVEVSFLEQADETASSELTATSLKRFPQCRVFIILVPSCTKSTRHCR